jgi:Spy/CpxP family protein refolding chaperone
MDRNRWLDVVLIFSLAFNIAFVGIWGYHVFYVRPLLEKQAEQAGGRANGGTTAISGVEWADLELTPQQRQRLQALRTEVRPEVVQLRQEALAAQERYLELIEQSDPDPQEVQQALEQIAQLQARFRRASFQGLRRFHEMLDERQRDEFHRMFRRTFERGGPAAPRAGGPGRRGPMRGGPSGPPEGRPF